LIYKINLYNKATNYYYILFHNKLYKMKKLLVTVAAVLAMFGLASCNKAETTEEVTASGVTAEEVTASGVEVVAE